MRYGPRLPLIVGPLVVALGFVLFAVPSVGNSYWKTFFPPVIGLGLGMAITIAPLTTVVMDSVGQDRVGAASGINNAVARIALKPSLRLQVLGVVMVNAFGTHLNRSLAHFMLPTNIVDEVQAGEIKLAGLQVPAGLDSNMRTAVTKSIGEAFVFGFRIVMLICAGLAVASSAVARLMIPNGALDLSSARFKQ